jgi:TPR repeat protein
MIEQGYALAELGLAEMYLDGEGVPEDFVEQLR